MFSIRVHFPASYIGLSEWTGSFFRTPTCFFRCVLLKHPPGIFPITPLCPFWQRWRQVRSRCGRQNSSLIHLGDVVIKKLLHLWSGWTEFWFTIWIVCVYIYIYMYRKSPGNDMATSEKSDPNGGCCCCCCCCCCFFFFFCCCCCCCGCCCRLSFVACRLLLVVCRLSVVGCCLLVVVCCLLFVTRPEDAGKPFSQLLRNPWGLLFGNQRLDAAAKRVWANQWEATWRHFQLPDWAEPLSLRSRMRGKKHHGPCTC